MTRINDFHLFAGGYVIVTLMGISQHLRSMGSIGATRVTRFALSARAEFFFEFVPFSASQRTRFMIHSKAWLPPPRMLFRTISAR